jgi:hypothetical protein
MSFFERAKAAANDLAAKADVAMTQAGISTPGTSATGGGAGGGDRALRDLGVLTYLEATGRPASADDRARLMATLHELESSGRLGPLTVTPSSFGAPGGPPPPPPPPGAAAAGPTPPPPPPPPGSYGTPPPPSADQPTPPGSTPPPPPPSWA